MTTPDRITINLSTDDVDLDRDDVDNLVEELGHDSRSECIRRLLLDAADDVDD